MLIYDSLLLCDRLHRQQLIHLETTSLLEKQNLIRTREAAMWELERLQMEQRCNVIRKHVRDFFYLQRHLMVSKQEKDLEHLRQLNAKLEEDLTRRQSEEKRLFLKSLRQEQRSRREMYRRSLYIVPSGSSAQQLAEVIGAGKLLAVLDRHFDLGLGLGPDPRHRPKPKTRPRFRTLFYAFWYGNQKKKILRNESTVNSD